MELIDLVNSVLIYLPQFILFRWLTILLGSLTVTLSPALLDSFLSSDARICSAMALPLLEILLMLLSQFPLTFL